MQSHLQLPNPVLGIIAPLERLAGKGLIHPDIRRRQPTSNSALLIGLPLIYWSVPVDIEDSHIPGKVGVDTVDQLPPGRIDIILHLGIDFTNNLKVSSWVFACVRILTSFWEKASGLGSRTVEWSCISRSIYFYQKYSNKLIHGIFFSHPSLQLSNLIVVGWNWGWMIRNRK